MKKIIKKTRKEIDQETLMVELAVSDTNYFYWACDKCYTAFFAGDVILQEVGRGYKRCTNMVSNFLGDKMCLGNLYGGDKESFDRYYKVVQETDHV